MKMTMLTTGRNAVSSLGVALILAGVLTTSFALATRKASPPAVTAKHQPAKESSKAAPRSDPAHRYGNLPLSFEGNQGQMDSEVQFVSRGSGYLLFLTKSEAFIELQQQDASALALERMKPTKRKLFESGKFYRGSPRFRKSRKTQTIRVAMVGANPNSEIEPLKELPGKNNYFIGNDPQKWRTGIPTFERVKYSEMYPGIDLIYYGNQRQLEFDFVVAPGADPGNIDLRIQTEGRLFITERGNLRIRTDDGSFELRRPEIYQIKNGMKQHVAGTFVQHRDHSIGFQLGVYDHRSQLIIDPSLAYSTYLGGNGTDDGFGVALDASGNAYVVGQTTSTNFPALNSYSSSANASGLAFISKLNPTGTALLYSTYLGGSGGESGNGIALDPAGNVYVAGYTMSTDFPVVNGFQTSIGTTNANAFVARIDTTQTGTASLVYSTYLGGGGNSTNPLGDVAYAIAADASGLAYVTGQTTSDTSAAPFPTTTSAYQASLGSPAGNAFLAVLDTNQAGAVSLLYSTYLGGASTGFGDYGDAISVDSAGNAYITGSTTSGGSVPFPTTPSAYQVSLNSAYSNAFVTEIATTQSGSASLGYSTYLGGSGDSSDESGDYGQGIAIDSLGKVYVSGTASSADFPVTSGAYQTTNPNDSRSFVSKLDPTQSGTQSLTYSTFLGGSGGDEGNGIAVDANGNAYVVGGTSSSDFPTTTGAFQTTLNSAFSDAFFTELNSTGTGLIYSTYLGGSCADGDVGNAIALDSLGNVYIVGSSCSTDFPVFPSAAFQTSLSGDQNAFVAKLSVPAPLPTITGISPTSAEFGVTVEIEGSNFGVSQGSSTVTFNGVPATVSSWSSTVIYATVPMGATTGSIVVTVGAVASNGAAFVVESPSITAISPMGGEVGTNVEVIGSNFGTTQGSSTITFNGTAATPLSWSDTIIYSAVPMGATTGNVVVTVAGATSNGFSFSVGSLLSLALAPQSPSVALGATLQFTATGTFSDGSTQNLSGAATWNSSTVSVANVNTVGLATAAGVGQTTIQSTVRGLTASTILTVLPGFAVTGNLNTARSGQTATVLNNGMVLLAGGFDANSNALASAELYNPSTGTFGATGNLITARANQTASVLNNGMVLVAGGFDSNFNTLASAELYDPSTGAFTATGNLGTARAFHTASVLNTGMVLVAGGNSGGAMSSAELYNPLTGTFAPTGNLNTARWFHTANLLNNGAVLVAGGLDSSGNVLGVAELYNSTTGSFTTTGTLVTPRFAHTATLLDNGQVLLAGGLDTNDNVLAAAELYNPATGNFTSTGSMIVAGEPTAALLGNGMVLLLDGWSNAGNVANVLNTAELYDPVAGSFVATGNLNVAHYLPTETLLSNGDILVAGGSNNTSTPLAAVELYQPATLTPANLGSIALSPAGPSVPLGSVQSFTATGTFGDSSTQTLASVTWSSSNNAVAGVTNDVSNHGTAHPLAVGSTTINACTGSVCGSTTMTVGSPTLVSITISPANITVNTGLTVQFDAAGTFTDGTTADLTSTVTWSCSSPNVASISSSGFATGVSAGIATIQASSGSVVAQTNLIVAPPALVSIAISPTTATIPSGANQQYLVSGTYNDGSVRDVTGLVAWSSSPSGIATVSMTGLATGTSQGTTALTATFESISGSSSLNVGSPALLSLSITPNAASLAVGATQQFTAQGTYTDGSTQNLTASTAWLSSNTSMASINGGGLATGLAAGNTAITATSGTTSARASLFVTAGSAPATLNTGRYLHSATILGNGQILIAGGISCASVGSCTYLNAAEIYNQTANTFTNTGSMSAPRSAPAVLLTGGKVLIAGGYSCDTSGNCSSLSGAEIYDPSSGTFSGAGNMTVARSGHTVTVLNDGTVLIAGGENCSSATSCVALASAERYDPVAGTFTYLNQLNYARFGATATLLNNGEILIAGGYNGSTFPAPGEIYFPKEGFFGTTSNNLNTPSYQGTATLLNNGKVLIAGGSTCAPPGCPTSAAELYDPNANTFSSIGSGMNVARFSHTATLLTNGQVLIAGGYSSCTSSCVAEASTELFDPVAATITSSQTLTTGVAGQSGTVISNGNVLLIGGINSGITVEGDEWYQPASLTPPGLVSIAITPSNLFLLPGQLQQLIATGTFNDGSTQTMQSVIWSSSNLTVACISNAVGVAGIADVTGQGTTTLAATAGAVGGSTTLTVEIPSSIAVSPSNSTVIVGTTQPFSALGTFADGSTRDLTTSATWSVSNSSVATISNLQLTQGVAAAVSAGTDAITATFAGVSGMTTVTVVPAVAPVVPTITSVTPTTGSSGTQVTIAGSGFGAAQGTGCVYLGTGFGVIVSWADGQIVAKVAPGSQSGIVQVLQGGQQSNSIVFTVNGPTITGISPSSGLAGTSVTITGSGFGAAQGNGQTRLGSVNGIVTSWSDTQVVAVVPTGDASGAAQILQNGAWSNSVAFTVNSPQIASVNPNPTAAGTQVTITGTGFGATQGSGVVWLGSTNGVVVGWSDTQVTATVASNALSGIVRIQQNGVWSNAESITISSLDGSTALTITPNVITMVVSYTRAIKAVNAQGQSVTGLTWVSSNTNVASLSTDDPPIITALAAGHATITAGNASADLTVSSSSSLSAGTVLWSNPGDGSGVLSVVPAVPSPTGVADVFAFQASGNVEAITADGTIAWTANLTSGGVPDFQGGLVVAGPSGPNQTTIQKLDGITGQPYPAYTSTGGSILLVHTDGTIFTTNNGSIVGVDPLTGSEKFSIPLPQSESINSGNCGDFAPFDNFFPTYPGQGIIAGDGYAYFPYQYGFENVQKVCNPDGTESGTTQGASHARLLRVGTDGSSTVITVGDSAETTSWDCVPPQVTIGGECPYTFTSTSSSSSSGVALGTLLTNADQGVVMSGSVCTSSSCTGQLSAFNAGGMTSTVSTQVPLDPILQRSDGSFVGFAGNNMAAFDLSGNVEWSVPNYSPLMVTAGGGVIAQSTDGLTTSTFDANGNAIGQLGNLPTYSWNANWYTDSGAILSQLTLSPLTPDTSFETVSGGNLSGTITSVPFLTWLEADPIWGGGRGPACQTGDVKTPLAGNALTQYTNLKQALLGGGFLTCPSCSAFFSASPTRASYLSQLTSAVTNQVPYDGTTSTISMYDAGLWTAKDTTNPLFPTQWKKTPVCAELNSARTVAEAQTQAPATDVYFNTKLEKKYVTQATILHEALHNLTHLGDDDLEILLGLPSTASKGAPTDVIDKVLESNSCAVKSKN
jgi:Bacterial Ig-like domain (group 2)/IPT/TIG domain/Beta-propeller repeat/Galactose oxidase, central domain